MCLLAFLCAVATFLPLIETNAWWIRALSFPRLQILVALAVIGAALIALPGRFHPLSLAGLGLAVAGFIGQAVVLYPYSEAAAVQARTDLLCAPEDRLRVAAVNVEMTNEHAEVVLGMLENEEPDLILFQETDPWWDERLSALEEAYPYSAEHITSNYFGIHLLSKRPLVDPEIHFLTSSQNASIFTGVTLHSGQVVSFYGLHPRPPGIGQSTAERDGQILATALAIAQDDKPSIMAGDLNAAPWSAVVRRAARIAGLLDPRIGRGWMPTFVGGPIVVRWPIDHILFRNQFALGDFRTLPSHGSDHRPIVADLCFEPEAGARQHAPAPEPGDIRSALKAVIAAQNKAVPSRDPAPGAQEPDAASAVPWR